MTQNTPKQGDIVFVDAEPHLGKEYGGHNLNAGNIRRPLIVLSNDDYNEATGMVIGMFVTSSDKFMNEMLKPFADFESGVKGNIVLWQLPTYDAAARHLEVVGHAKPSLVKELKQERLTLGSETQRNFSTNMRLRFLHSLATSNSS